MNHSSHKDQIARLNRIEGQIRGISKMIDSDKYCIDILNQIKAVKNALSSVEANILEKHLAECVKDTLGNGQHFEKKVDEIIKTLKR